MAKKDGKVRLVVDCRRANAHFAPPGKTQLTTGASLASLRAEGVPFEVASYDIKNAFYNFSLPPCLRKFSGMPPLRAMEAGVRRLGGRAVHPNTLLHPRLAILPMGWSHALWWCQLLHCRILEGVPGLGRAARVVDGEAPPELDKPVHAIYVDNGIIIARSGADANILLHRAVGALRAKGLPIHDVCEAASSATVLGWVVDGAAQMVRPKPERVRRTRLAIDWALKQTRVCPKDLEKLVGHMSFLGLVCRPSLAVLGATHVLINRARGSDSCVLWPSVRR